MKKNGLTIRQCSSISSIFKNLPEDNKKMSVRELESIANKKLSEYREEKDKKYEKVCNEFRGKYIKIKESGMLKETKYIFINKISPGCHTECGDRGYSIFGEEVSVNKHFPNVSKLKGGNGDVYGNELSTAEIITKKEFNSAKNAVKDILNQLEKLSK